MVLAGSAEMMTPPKAIEQSDIPVNTAPMAA
jgi:hypothetical protein